LYETLLLIDAVAFQLTCLNELFWRYLWHLYARSQFML